MKKKDGGGSYSIYSDKIRAFLEEGPASINDICKELRISWATAKSVIEEMKEKEDVKEIVTSKIRIFNLSNDPAFYGVPLNKKQKNDALFLFDVIKKEWKSNHEKERGPLLATTLQKIAVDVAKKCDCDIPVVPFHYGLVVPVVANPYANFSKPSNHNQITKVVIKIMPSHTNKYNKEIEKQYSDYNLEIFKAKQEILSLLKQYNGKFDMGKIKNIFSKFLLLCPTDSKEIKLFSLCSDFIDNIYGLILSENFQSRLEDIKDAFNIIWDYITTYLFFKEIAPYVRKEKEEIFEYIKTLQLLSKKSNVEERINYLDSLVDLTKEIQLPMDDESIMIRKILSEGAEEE